MCRTHEEEFLILVTFRDVTFRDLTLTLTCTHIALNLTRYFHYAFEATLVEFRAKSVDIADPRLRHTELSKFVL